MKLPPSQQVIIACILWSYAALTRKLVLVSISPFLLNFLNCVFGILIIALFSKINLKQLLSSFVEYKFLFILNSFFGVTVGISLSYYSIEKIDLSLYGLLVKIQPIFVLLLARFFLKEKIDSQKIPYILFAIMCSFLISYDDGLNINKLKIIGIIAAILTALSFSISTISGKAIIEKNVSPDQATIIRFFLGATMLSPTLLIEPLTKSDSINLLTYFWFVTGIISSSSAFILYYKSLKQLEASEVTILELLMPIFTVSMGFLFLGETLSLLQILTSVVLLLCIIKLQLTNK